MRKRFWQLPSPVSDIHLPEVYISTNEGQTRDQRCWFAYHSYSHFFLALCFCGVHVLKEKFKLEAKHTDFCRSVSRSVSALRDPAINLLWVYY